MIAAFTQAQLDAIEKPLPRQRVGKAVPGGPSERVIQRAIVGAVRRLGIFVFHVPNGAHLYGGHRQWQALKADGAWPGMCDLILIDKDGDVGAWEIKKPGSCTTADQDACHKALKARRVRVAVITSVEEALLTLKEWGWV